jgi:hypothetical protein
MGHQMWALAHGMTVMAMTRVNGISCRRTRIGSESRVVVLEVITKLAGEPDSDLAARKLQRVHVVLLSPQTRRTGRRARLARQEPEGLRVRLVDERCVVFVSDRSDGA